MASHTPLHGWRVQRGSSAVALLLMMLALVTMLGLVEVGYLYWARRDTQKIADLAALAGAQRLSQCAADNQGNTAASNNATVENGFTGTLAITCGTWDPVANAATSDHFSATAPGATPNAVKVTARRPVLPIYRFTGTLPSVGASAVASGLQPVAVFSVGTKLASVNANGALSQLLDGVGIPIKGTSLAGYDGLANVTVTPAGLLKQLGVQVPADITVAGLNALLASQAQARALIDVLNATVTAAGRQDLLAANAALVNAVTATLGAPPGNVTLGSSNGAGGLFAQIVAPDAATQTALNAQVNALQLLSTAIGVASGAHAVGSDINVSPNSTFGILGVTAQTRVIEPPSLGIGGVGTTAYTAQVRTYLRLALNTNGIPLIGNLINLQLDLPLAIDLVDAKATLTDLCTTTDSANRPLATIGVTSNILKACAGDISPGSVFSTAAGCDQIPGASSPHLMMNLGVGTGSSATTLASLNTHFNTSALSANGSGTFYAGQSKDLPAGGTALTIGTAVNNLMTALTTALVTQSTAGDNSQTLSSLPQDLWNATSSVLSNTQRLQQALGQMQSASQGLQGLLGSATGQVADMLGNTLSLNIPGLLGSTVNLLGSITGALGQVVNNLLCPLSQSSCIAVIQGAMKGTTGTVSNAFTGLLGFLVQKLQGPLNAVGTQVLTPVLQNGLGIDLGLSTVKLHSLQCHGVQLVY